MNASMNDLRAVDLVMGGVGPWYKLVQEEAQPHWITALDGGGRITNCTNNLFVTGIYRDPGPGSWYYVGTGKCNSPTPNLPMKDCYLQNTADSF